MAYTALPATADFPLISTGAAESALHEMRVRATARAANWLIAAGRDVLTEASINTAISSGDTTSDMFWLADLPAAMGRFSPFSQSELDRILPLELRDAYEGIAHRRRAGEPGFLWDTTNLSTLVSELHIRANVRARSVAERAVLVRLGMAEAPALGELTKRYVDAAS